jgi:hypothetical protein
MRVRGNPVEKPSKFRLDMNQLHEMKIMVQLFRE